MALAITVSLNRVRQTWTGHCGSAPAVPFRQSPFPGRLDTGPSTVRVPRIRRRGVGPSRGTSVVRSRRIGATPSLFGRPPNTGGYVTPRDVRRMADVRRRPPSASGTWSTSSSPSAGAKPRPASTNTPSPRPWGSLRRASGTRRSTCRTCDPSTPSEGFSDEHPRSVRPHGVPRGFRAHDATARYHVVHPLRRAPWRPTASRRRPMPSLRADSPAPPVFGTSE